MIRFVFAPPGLGPVDQDPDNVREEACRIVSPNQKVCTPATTTPPKVAGGSSFDLSWVSLLIWVLLIAGVIALVVLLVRFVVGRGWNRRPRRDDEADLDLDEMELAAVAVDRSREPVNWRAEADDHRRAGRFRDALRCRYRALVGDLARRGLIDEIPGRTTGEERAQLGRARPAASGPFTAAADLFDDAWYGHIEVAAGDDDRFQALERDVLSVAGVRR
jgi:hypothetical protein